MDHSQLHSCPPPHPSELFCLVASRRTPAKKRRPEVVDLSEEQEHPFFLLDDSSENLDVHLLVDNKESDQMVKKLDTVMIMVRLASVWKRQRI